MKKILFIILPVLLVLIYIFSAMNSFHQIHKGIYYNDKKLIKEYVEWDELRDIRTQKLLRMDKFQLSIIYDNLTDTQRAELQQYRQELLDLPQDFNTPQEAYDNIPTKPTWFD